METTQSHLWDLEIFRSYPTYEEWKLIFCSGIKFIGVSSYPTYEEWKRKISGSLSKHCISSYPTYEEWKPRTIN